MSDQKLRRAWKIERIAARRKARQKLYAEEQRKRDLWARNMVRDKRAWGYEG